MMTTFTPLGISFVLFAIAVTAALVYLYRVTWRLEQFKKGLIAHAKLAPSAPTARLVEGWRKLYDSLPEGSPKWTAYRNRLIEVGVLDDEGKPVKTDNSVGD